MHPTHAASIPGAVVYADGSRAGIPADHAAQRIWTFLHMAAWPGYLNAVSALLLNMHAKPNRFDDVRPSCCHSCPAGRLRPLPTVGGCAAAPARRS